MSSVKPSKAYSRGSVVMVDEIMNASPSKFRFPEAGLRVMVTSHFGPRTRLRMASRLIITEVQRGLRPPWRMFSPRLTAADVVLNESALTEFLFPESVRSWCRRPTESRHKWLMGRWRSRTETCRRTNPLKPRKTTPSRRFMFQVRMFFISMTSLTDDPILQEVPNPVGSFMAYMPGIYWENFQQLSVKCIYIYLTKLFL